MLSLAYRIATMKTFVKNPPDDELKSVVIYCKKNLMSVPHFRLDNIAKFALEHPKTSWNPRDDIPNWAPPFMKFWCEWVDRGTQHGVFAKCAATPDDIQQDDPKWIMDTALWISNSGKNGGFPILWGSTVILIQQDGKVIQPDKFIQRIEEHCLPHHLVFGLGVSFMHCKNVRKIETKDDPGERFRKQYGVPKYTYRTLEINPMKEVLRRDGKSESQGIQRALHDCHGYFATYTEEKPLFGKYPGTFYVPEHKRGRKECGEVVKDYDVKPGASDEL